MQIVIYSQHLRRVSGLTTFERIFCKKMSKYHHIKFVYKTADVERLAEIGKYAETIQDVGQIITGDICVYSSLQHGFPKPLIQVKKRFQVVHTDLKAWNVHYNKLSEIDQYIAVGEGVAKSLKEHFDIDAIVIPNMLDDVELEPVLRLMTASRIEKGKGFERCIKLAKMLKIARRRFIWEIYGDGANTYLNELKYNLANVPEVVFMGPRDSIQSYMVKSDYLVQLSDSEGFCYSIFEALQVGVPCIVTEFEGVDQVIQNGVNGYIVDMDLTNLNFEALYNRIPKGDKLVSINDSENQWVKLLN